MVIRYEIDAAEHDIQSVIEFVDMGVLTIDEVNKCIADFDEESVIEWKKYLAMLDI